MEKTILMGFIIGAFAIAMVVPSAFLRSLVKADANCDNGPYGDSEHARHGLSEVTLSIALLI